MTGRPLYRLFAALAIVLVLAYPVQSFLSIAEVPWWVRLAWPALALLAWRWPGPSLLAFVAISPVLPIVPSRAGWPEVSLPGQWLYALLVPAWLRVSWRPERRALPVTALLLLALVTSSLVATIAPFALGQNGFGGLLASLHAFLRDDFSTLTGARHVYASVLAWAVVVEGVGLGWLLLRYLRDGGEAGHLRLAAAAACGAGLVAVWGVRQWWTRDDLLPFWTEFDPFIVRINASFTDVNTLGSYLAAMVPVLVALWAWTRDRALWTALLAGSATAVAATIFTASRSAWVSLLAGLILYAGLTWRTGVWQLAPERAALVRRLVAAGVLAAIVLVVGLSTYATAIDARHIQQRSYFDTALHTLNLRVPIDDRFKGRVQLWQAALRMTASSPTSGIGIGRYYRDVSLFAPNPDALIRKQENAHNYPLQLMAETGVPTTIVWFAMLGALVLRGYRYLRDATVAPNRHLVAAGIGGGVAFILTCLTGHPLLLREGQVAMWTVLAIAAGPGVGGRMGWRAETGLSRVLLVACMLVILWTPFRAMHEIGRVDLSRHIFGAYAEEHDSAGAPFRWTSGRATYFVPEGARVLQLSVRSVAPTPQALAVVFDGRLVDTLRLDDQQWRPLEYVLPRKADAGRFHKVELITTPTWTPINDPRELGVMVTGFDWRQ